MKKHFFKFDDPIDEILIIIQGVWKNRKEVKAELPTSDSQDLSLASVPEVFILFHSIFFFFFGSSFLPNQHPELILSNSDWNVLIQSTYKKTFSQGSVIISEGEVHNRIFQIARGRCRIEKNVKDAPVSIGFMNANDIFGEISFLQQGAATASILADTDVDLYIFEGFFFSSFFEFSLILDRIFHQHFVCHPTRVSRTILLLPRKHAFGTI